MLRGRVPGVGGWNQIVFELPSQFVFENIWQKIRCSSLWQTWGESIDSKRSDCEEVAWTGREANIERGEERPGNKASSNRDEGWWVDITDSAVWRHPRHVRGPGPPPP